MHSEAAPWLQGLGTEHESSPRLAQPFENTVFQRGTGFLIIPWSLVRIQAGPVVHKSLPVPALDRNASHDRCQSGIGEFLNPTQTSTVATKCLGT